MGEFRISNTILFLFPLLIQSTSIYASINAPILEKRQKAWEHLDFVLTHSEQLISAQELTNTYSKNYPSFTEDEKFGVTPVGLDKIPFTGERRSFPQWRSPQRTLYSTASAQHILSEFYPLTDCLRDPSKNSDSRVTCLGKEFPMGSYIVKFQWRRLEGSKGIPVPLTSNEDLAQLYQHSYEWKQFSMSWVRPELILNIGPKESYALVGVHLMEKTTRDWVWISAWWSPEDSSNFAEDRPNTLISKWLKKAKLCIVDAHKDQAEKTFENHPSLSRAYQITNEFNEGYSWCSNPYIEHGAGNAKTNCMGCHQYAGQNLNPLDLLKASITDPLVILKQDNDQVPLDYSWSIIQGEKAVGLEILDWRNYFETQWTKKKPSPKPL